MNARLYPISSSFFRIKKEEEKREGKIGYPCMGISMTQ